MLLLIFLFFIVKMTVDSKKTGRESKDPLDLHSFGVKTVKIK